jgi:hypothetical protein
MCITYFSQSDYKIKVTLSNPTSIYNNGVTDTPPKKGENRPLSPAQSSKPASTSNRPSSGKSTLVSSSKSAADALLANMKVALAPPGTVPPPALKASVAPPGIAPPPALKAFVAPPGIAPPPALKASVAPPGIVPPPALMAPAAQIGIAPPFSAAPTASGNTNNGRPDNTASNLLAQPTTATAFNRPRTIGHQDAALPGRHANTNYESEEEIHTSAPVVRAIKRENSNGPKPAPPSLVPPIHAQNSGKSEQDPHISNGPPPRFNNKDEVGNGVNYNNNLHATGASLPRPGFSTSITSNLAPRAGPPPPGRGLPQPVQIPSSSSSSTAASEHPLFSGKSSGPPPPGRGIPAALSSASNSGKSFDDPDEQLSGPSNAGNNNMVPSGFRPGPPGRGILPPSSIGAARAGPPPPGRGTSTVANAGVLGGPMPPGRGIPSGVPMSVITARGPPLVRPMPPGRGAPSSVPTTGNGPTIV